VIFSTLMQPTVLTARALIRLLGSLQSFKNVMKDVGHVKLGLGIVHQVEDKLLQLQVVCLHAVDHVGEECQHVLPHGHAGDHLLHCFTASLFSFYLNANHSCSTYFTGQSTTEHRVTSNSLSFNWLVDLHCQYSFTCC
jgi:hypothetical protein